MPALAALAQTPTGGAITSDTIWRAAQSPYVVGSDIVVQNGATLTIEAGTTVSMGAGTRFTVQSGALKAVGTAQAPIRMTSDKLRSSQEAAPGDWQQLTFSTGISNTTRLEYVQIEYGQGVVVAGASPVFDYVTIRNNQGAAITADLASSLSGVGNTATGNALNAVAIPSGEISGTVTWGLRGIPYVVASGTVSVGATPRITAISPDNMQVGETKTITVTGSRLTGLSKPAFDLAGLNGQVLTGATDTQAQVQLTAASNATTGSAQFSAVTDAGEVKFANALTVMAIQPALSAVTPSTLATGQGDAIVSLSGQHFVNTSVAYLDTSALATTFVNDTTITAVVPNQTDNAVKSLTLRTPRPGGGAEYISNAKTITFLTPPPVVNSVSPSTLRRGETAAIQISGTGLNAVSLTTSDASLTIGNVALTPTQASFNLTAAANTPLGAQKITLKNASGTAYASFTVAPALPTATVSPTPIAVPPDSSTRQFAIQLSYTDTVAHTFTVTAADTSVAKVSTSTLTIAPGQVQVIGGISGLKNGVTSLSLASPTLGNLSVPVYVTADFLGLNTAYSPTLGVVLTPSSTDIPQISISPVSRSLGVAVGPFVQDMTPKAFSIDGGTQTLTISGSGLESAIAVTLKPADGVTVGSVTPAPDGKTVSVPLTVATDAPVSPRQVVLSSASGAYPVASPGADRILITLPHPEIASIDPIYALPGTSSLNLIVRGRNLQGVQSVSISPAEGITFGTSPTVNADGTQLNAVMTIASSAAVGPRVISVVSPAGTSETAASAANTFTVVAALPKVFTPIVSPSLGIVKTDNTPPANQSMSLVSRALGLAVGAVATDIAPQAKAVGETFTLSVQGVGLDSVTGISLAPATGLSLGTPTIAADGLSLTVPVTIAADAPQTVRKVQLLAGTTPILFAKPGNGMFTVTAVRPVIESTDPNVIKLGAAAVVMTVRGQNFQSAQSVRFVPPDGMTVTTPPTVNGDATQLTVNVSASSAATPGPRAVIVTTPGGESSAEMSVVNTVTLGSSVSTTGLVSPILGIVKQDNVPPATTTYGPLMSSNLGIVFGDAPPPATFSLLAVSRPLGVSLGSVVNSLQPRTLPLSSSGTLTVSGAGLENVTGISVNPAQGVTIGSPVQISEDGLQVTAPVTVAADAAMTQRQVSVSTASGKVVFANPSIALVQITSGAELPISSISPILSTTGSSLTLTVRGQNLQNASAVIATPATGLAFDAQPTVNAAGTELTIRIQIAADAPLGARVIQVITPTATSSAQASPANTFTVYAP